MNQISKSDFKVYFEAPRHLWALKHGLCSIEQSAQSQNLIDQGYQVEALAWDWARAHFAQDPDTTLLFQQGFSRGHFTARTDILAFHPSTATYDLYEVKAVCTIDKDILYDLAFQVFVLESNLQLGGLYILHLNKDYHRGKELDLNELFVLEDVSKACRDLRADVEAIAQQALFVLDSEDPQSFPGCLDPKTCPCPDLCHPNLPERSIFELPRLSSAKKMNLLAEGRRQIVDIPEDFKLSDFQKKIVDSVKAQKEYINPAEIARELDSLQYPLWFLDYESAQSAIPLYEACTPYQQMIFQYSLHCLPAPGATLTHTGYISADPGNPMPPLLEHMQAALGPVGSVIVWNRSFEETRNKEMAAQFQDYAQFLLGVNARMYDLMTIVSRGFYWHPEFHGSYSIKKVLPVLVPSLSYADLEINVGTMATEAWWQLQREDLTAEEREEIKQKLFVYCRLDTLAMVEIYHALRRKAGL